MPELLNMKTSQMATQTKERFQIYAFVEMKIWMEKQGMRLKLKSRQIVATYSTDLYSPQTWRLHLLNSLRKPSSLELNV